MNNNTQKPKDKYRFIKLILGIFLLRWVVNKINRIEEISRNFREFFRAEKREVEKLESGRRSFRQYCRNSCSIFHEYFIPSERNDHRPKILKPRSLVVITILSTLIKVIVVGYLFFIYPNRAIMSEVVIRKVFELTNQSREEAGLKPLTMNSVLSASAAAKANDMIANDYFAHHSPSGKKPWDWVSRSDYPYILVGENLAMNFATADGVHTALMNSPSHKKNIMNEKYKDLGLAMVSGEIDGKETNVLVELFATTGNSVKAASAVTETKSTSVTVSDIPVAEKKVAVEMTPVKKETVPATVTEKNNTVVDSKTVNVSKAAPVTSSKKEEVKVIAKTEIASTSVENEKEISVAASEAELEDNLNHQVTYTMPDEDLRFGIATSLVRGTNIFYAGLLIFMFIALLINIFVKISVQHKPVIIQSLIVILFIVSLASVKVHFLENVISQIAIL